MKREIRIGRLVIKLTTTKKPSRPVHPATQREKKIVKPKETK